MEEDSLGQDMWVNIQKYFHENDFGYYRSERKALDAIAAYQIAQQESFHVTRTRRYNFEDLSTRAVTSSKGKKKYSFKIRWFYTRDNGEKHNDGIPFVIEEVINKQCEHGPSKRKRQRKRLKKSTLEEEEDITDCCEAVIIIKKIVKFPQFAVNPPYTVHKADYQSLKMRDALTTSNQSVIREERWYVEFPREKDHKYHATGMAETSIIELSEQVRTKLDQLHADHPDMPSSELRHHLRAYVIEELDIKPPSSGKGRSRTSPRYCDKSYFPTCVDIDHYRLLTNLNHHPLAYAFHDPNDDRSLSPPPPPIMLVEEEEEEPPAAKRSKLSYGSDQEDEKVTVELVDQDEGNEEKERGDDEKKEVEEEIGLEMIRVSETCHGDHMLLTDVGLGGDGATYYEIDEDGMAHYFLEDCDATGEYAIKTGDDNDEEDEEEEDGELIRVVMPHDDFITSAGLAGEYPEDDAAYSTQDQFGNYVLMQVTDDPPALDEHDDVPDPRQYFI